MCKKKIILLVGFLILLVVPLVSAVNYGSETYGFGLYGIGEVIGEVSAPSSGGGGGGCTYDWECTNWFPSECQESEIQERICANKGTCTGTTGIPDQTKTCIYEGLTEPLFDIFLTFPDKDKEICAGERIGANIQLENYGKIEFLDAFMTYWILNENNTLIAELKDTRSVEDEINFDISIKVPISATQGAYRLYVQIDYDKNKTAVAGESFEIIVGTQCKAYSSLFAFLDSIKNSKQIPFIVGVGIFLVIIILMTIIKKKKLLERFKDWKERKKIEVKTKLTITEEETPIKEKGYKIPFLIILLTLSFIILFFKSILNFSKNLWNEIPKFISSFYLTFLNWINPIYIYILAIILIILSIILYLKRYHVKWYMGRLIE